MVQSMAGIEAVQVEYVTRGQHSQGRVSVGRMCHLREGILCPWESSHENRLAWQSR